MIFNIIFLRDHTEINLQEEQRSRTLGCDRASWAFESSNLIINN